MSFTGRFFITCRRRFFCRAGLEYNDDRLAGPDEISSSKEQPISPLSSIVPVFFFFLFRPMVFGHAIITWKMRIITNKIVERYRQHALCQRSAFSAIIRTKFFCRHYRQEWLLSRKGTSSLCPAVTVPQSSPHAVESYDIASERRPVPIWNAV